MTPFDNLTELSAKNTRLNDRISPGMWLINRLLSNIDREDYTSLFPAAASLKNPAQRMASRQSLSCIAGARSGGCC